MIFYRAAKNLVVMETSTKEGAELEQYRISAAIHKVQVKHIKGQYSKPCFRCARTGHCSDDCKFKDAQCHKCKEKGHIKPVCRSNAYGNQHHQCRHSSCSSTGGKHADSQHAHVHVVKDVYDSDAEKYM